jgi:glucose/arabinose dehydrogenase
MVGGAPILKMLPSSIHEGGALEFSPVDGMLYLANGDRGSGAGAQSLDYLLGKMLRIDVSRWPYMVPDGNMPGGLPEIWDHGLRNPWRATFDACTGDLFIADVGGTQREELNIEPAGEGHRNYGWDIMEGTECEPVTMPCDDTGLTPPAIDYGHVPHPDGFSVIIGGMVYRGSSIPALRAAYIHGNINGRMFLFRHDAGVVTEAAELSVTYEGAPYLQAITSFGQDHEGEMYVVQYDPGRILKIVAAP